MAAAERLGPGSSLLVTGGAGFIGSCFVREILGRDDGTRITVLDTLTYAGNEANLQPILDDPGQAARLHFVRGDIADPAAVRPLVAEADAVVNFAAESHVDRSILDPEAFLRTGVIGVHVLLDACRAEAAALAAGERRTATGDARPAPRYLQVSTDEVYGSVESGRSVETDALAPRSPYSAAKASGELLVRSYVVTHGVDAVVTRGSNTYGPYHHPEKLIPLFITNALEDRPLPLSGDGSRRCDRVRPAPRPERRDLQHPGFGRADQPGGRPAAARGPGQALVAGPDGRGPARPRSALRPRRLEAGGARLAQPG